MAEKAKRRTGRTGGWLDVSDPKVYEAIRQRAYELYCNRGRAEGNDMQDWLQAEKEIRREMGSMR